MSVSLLTFHSFWQYLICVYFAANKLVYLLTYLLLSRFFFSAIVGGGRVVSSVLELNMNDHFTCSTKVG